MLLIMYVHNSHPQTLNEQEGNNLLQLAVLSRSSNVLHDVIFALDKHLETDGLRPYFDNGNKVRGITAIQIVWLPRSRRG